MTASSYLPGPRNDTMVLTKTLEEKGFKAEALNGDLAQAARERTINR